MSPLNSTHIVDGAASPSWVIAFIRRLHAAMCCMACGSHDTMRLDVGDTSRRRRRLGPNTCAGVGLSAAPAIAGAAVLHALVAGRAGGLAKSSMATQFKFEGCLADRDPRSHKAVWLTEIHSHTSYGAKSPHMAIDERKVLVAADCSPSRAPCSKRACNVVQQRSERHLADGLHSLTELCDRRSIHHASESLEMTHG